MESDRKDGGEPTDRDAHRESGLWYLAGALGMLVGGLSWGMGVALMAMSQGSGSGSYLNTSAVGDAGPSTDYVLLIRHMFDESAVAGVRRTCVSGRE